MYQVKNLRTGRTTKNAVTGAPFVFASKEEAEIHAAGLNGFARAGEKRDAFVVVAN